MNSQYSHRVYLDHAATTPVRTEVSSVVSETMDSFYGNPSSIYREGQDAKRLLEESRDSVANFLNATGSEIYFTSCGTESDNWAIKGVALNHFGQKMHIITSSVEHHAVLHSCKSLEKIGYEITYLPVDSFGLVNPEDLKRAIRENTALVSIMMANNEIGTIQPVKELCAIAKEKGALFHTDAVQAAGAIPIDVRDLGVDLLSVSGHKVYAPKGVGALYVRRGVKLSNLLDGGAQEHNRRAGTENLPYICGFAKALSLAAEEMSDYSLRISDIRDELIQSVLDRIPHVRLNGHPEKRLPGNVNFSFEFIEGESLLLMLDHHGFSCSSGSACTSGSLDPSHVLLAIGLPHEIAHGSLRISIGRDNTKEQVLGIVPVLEKVANRLREMSPLYEDYVNRRETTYEICEKCLNETDMKK
ncbi:MAG: cysteine desulfurase NifS [Clostridiaceae bacterium]|nr:cysteine desulfurase NifS [Clostridiaceae bacterium]